VQGDGAEESLIRGVDYFDRSNLVDVIIIGRGGGSIEDLWAFNSERLARRIFSARLPVISAVGHETDFTICDFVSDRRAPTPSAAAEIAVPDKRELNYMLASLKARSVVALQASISGAEDEFRYLSSAAIFTDPCAYFSEKIDAVDALYEKANDVISLKIKDHEQVMALLLQKLGDINPLSVLARGYSVVSTNGRVLRSKEEVEIGDDISVRVRDGEISAKVNKKVN
jgi:exodeoxyribonuclease VII large subunit